MEEILKKWPEILKTVKEEFDLTDVSFEQWVLPLSPLSLNGNELTIAVPEENDRILGFIRKKYTQPLEVGITEVLQKSYHVVFTTKANSPKEQDVPDIPSDEGIINLNPNYTFDSFIVGSNNQIAYAASLAASEAPGEVYNPLLLYGGAGLGKTHLMHSIAHFILNENPNAVVRYVTSEKFTNELIEAIRNGSNARFREKYRNVDALLIDDIQFIIGKESTQEEFFHTFNELHTAKKQIIISSDKPPKDMQILEDRIRTRLEWGLLAHIGEPDYETRMAILKSKEENENFYLDDEILSYIARNITSNIRELEGALNKLFAYSKLTKNEITMENAISQLESIISPRTQTLITVDYIIDTVCDHFKIERQELVSHKKKKDVAYPRQLAMYLCRTMTDYSLDGIGKKIGKDHSTVLHGVQKIETGIKENDEKIKLDVDILKNKVTNH